MAKLKKRKDGRYQRKITLSDGRQKIVYGRTLAELNAAEDALREQDHAGLQVGDHTLVGEWARIWISSYKTGLRASTLRMYRGSYNKHIMPVLGGMELQDVRPVHIRTVMRRIADKSESTQHKVLLTMRQLFETARLNNLVMRNPADGIKITPRQKQSRKEYLTKDEAEQLLQAVTEPRARAFCALCLYAGLRKEEALGLRWTDISPASMAIVRGVTFPDGNMPDPRMELKNKASRRILPVPARLREVLDQTPHTSEYVVPSPSGGVMTSTCYERMWNTCVRPVVPYPIHAHMLRHTYATTLYHAGIDLRTAQQLLGHATIQMTANIYTHLEASDALTSVTRLDKFWEANSGKSSQKVVNP